jgi:hypothetical protein
MLTHIRKTAMDHGRGVYGSRSATSAQAEPDTGSARHTQSRCDASADTPDNNDTSDTNQVSIFAVWTRCVV